MHNLTMQSRCPVLAAAVVKANSLFLTDLQLCTQPSTLQTCLASHTCMKQDQHQGDRCLLLESFLGQRAFTSLWMQLQNN